MRKNARTILPLSIFLCLAFFFCCSGETSNLTVNSPADKTTTDLNRLYISGAAPGAKALYANSVKLEIENNGTFEAVAVLHPNRNVLEVSAEFPDNVKETKKIRILKIVTFDDMETLYTGRKHWARRFVLALATLGIIEGYPDNNFGVEKPLLRGELATWLARAKNLKTFPPKADVFYDVPKEHWRAPYIKAIVQAGYMHGISKDTFGIDEPIKRNEVAEIIAKAFDLQPLKKKSYFLDVKPTTKYSSYINAAQASGIVVGVPGNEKMFEPDREMRRTEAALLFASLKSMKALRASINDFNKGYSDDQKCRVGTKPIVVKTAAFPPEIPADGKTPLNISAAVDDAQGKDDIAQVWADLTPLGSVNNAKMTLVSSGVYELSFVMTSEVIPGPKTITIKALDKEGLSSVGQVNFLVTK